MAIGKDQEEFINELLGVAAQDRRYGALEKPPYERSSLPADVEGGNGHLNGSSSFNPETLVNSEPHHILVPSLSSAVTHRSQDEVLLDMDPHLFGIPSQRQDFPDAGQGVTNNITAMVLGLFTEKRVDVLSDLALKSSAGYLLGRMSEFKGATPVVVVVFLAALFICVARKR